MQPIDDTSAPGPLSRYRPAGILAVAAVVYLAGIGAYPLLDPDEGRYAEVAREMLESGDFVTPRLNYVKYLEKPPLFYWATAASLWACGETEWAVRLVPVVAGLLTVLVIYLLSRRMFGDRVALLSSWVYLTGLLPLVMARLPIIDGTFSLLLLCTWGAAWLGLASGRRGRYVAAWAALGLAVMSKGPVALVLCALVLGGFLLATRRLRELPSLLWWPGPLLFALVTVPWHLAVGLRNPEFWHFYFVVQHLGRVGSVEHAKPVWFFLAVLPVCMGLWGIPLFGALVQAGRGLLRRWRTGECDDDTQSTLYLLIWIVCVVGLFSLSRCKLVPYILPAFPALAILVARHMLGADRPGGEGEARFLPADTGRLYAWLTAGFLVLLIPVLAVVARHNRYVPMAEPLWLLQVGLALGAGMSLAAGVWRRYLPLAQGLCLLLLLPGLLQAVSLTADYRRTPILLEQMPQPLPEQVRIAELRTYDHSLGFYQRRRIIMVDNLGELAFGAGREPDPRFFVTGEEKLQTMAKGGPLLVNLRPQDWPRVRAWGSLHLVAANSRNVLVGNDGFLALMGLAALPPRDITPPMLLLPRRVAPRGGPDAAGGGRA